MLKAQYDTDVTIWSPQGRLFQVSYAMEAVKQGSAIVGLRSNELVVLCAIKRSQSKLASYQEKILNIDDHIAIGISGLTADARVIAAYLRQECTRRRFIFNDSMKVGRLCQQMADKAQEKTMQVSRRPYGVGLLMAGYDDAGPHLYELCPSGNFWEYKAMAIGGTSQSAKTYLAKHFETFENLNEQELVDHAVSSLKSQHVQGEVTKENLALTVIGLNRNHSYSEDEIETILGRLAPGDPEEVTMN